MIILAFLLMLSLPSAVFSATFYVDDTGNDSTGTGSSASPWKTFSHAINPARASCGDILLVKNGIYGPTSAGGASGTSRIDVNGLVCTLGNELTIRAENQRQAKIVDDGSSNAIRVFQSEYIVLDGLVAKSTNNSSFTTSQIGVPLYIRESHHVTARNGVYHNPNKYSSSGNGIYYSTHVLFEDNEIYDYHRHGVNVKWSSDVIIRRLYCHPRTGRIPGGQGTSQNGAGRGDACISLYPARDSVVENVIAEGPTYLIEVNAEYTGTPILSSPMPNINNKILGSICRVCSYGNAVFPSSRRPGINGTVQDILIRDIAVVDWASTANALRLSDCYGNCRVDHFTVLGTGVGARGITLDDDPDGVTAADNSVTMTNLLLANAGDIGLNVTGFNTWTANEVFSVGNTTAFSPSSSPNLTNTSTSAHGMGTCKLWAPVGAAVKGAGTGGSDINATILYRYVDGVLTSTPLWDPTTGAFPHGAATADGLNRVAGTSLYDVHTRLNVNTGGCTFPSGYGVAGTPSGPANHATGIGTTSVSINQTIPALTQGLLVAVTAYDTQGSVGAIGTPTACSGQSVTALSGGEAVTSPPYRRTKVFGITGPNTGTCTISVSGAAGTDFMAAESIYIAEMGSFGTPVAAGTATASSTPSVTVSTASGQTLYGFLGAKCNPSDGECGTSFAVGANETLLNDTATAGDLRLASVSQSGNNGGVFGDGGSMGGNNLWTYVVVPVLPESPDPPGSGVVTQTQYQFIYPIGSEDGAPISGTVNTARPVMPTAMVGFQVELTGSVETTASFGAHLYCRLNGGDYARVMNTFGSNVFRFYGAGAEATDEQVPASFSDLTQRLNAGSYVGGKVLRDEATVIVVPPLTVGQHYELRTVLRLNAAQNDAIDCKVFKDNGEELNAAGDVPAHMDVIPTVAGGGF